MNAPVFLAVTFWPKDQHYLIPGGELHRAEADLNKLWMIERVRAMPSGIIVEDRKVLRVTFVGGDFLMVEEEIHVLKAQIRSAYLVAGAGAL